MLNRLLLLAFSVIVISCDYAETEEILSISDSSAELVSAKIDYSSTLAMIEIGDQIYLPGDTTSLEVYLKGPYYKNNLKPIKDIYIDENEKAHLMAREYLKKIKVGYTPYFEETDNRVILFAFQLINAIKSFENNDPLCNENLLLKGAKVNNLVEYYAWSVKLGNEKYDPAYHTSAKLYEETLRATDKWTERLYRPYK